MTDLDERIARAATQLADLQQVVRSLSVLIYTLPVFLLCTSLVLGLLTGVDAFGAVAGWLLGWYAIGPWLLYLQRRGWS